MIKVEYKDYVYWNHHMQTYGNAMKISKNKLRLLIAFIAALPIGTSWMFLLLPKVKDLVIRY